MTDIATTQPYVFEIDLGANGGVVQAKIASELVNWIQTEASFWAWIASAPLRGPQFDVVQGAVNYLSPALQDAQALTQYDGPKFGQHRMEACDRIRQHLTTCYITLKLPHSSTPQGKRVEQLRLINPNAAIAMVYAITTRATDTTEPFAGLPVDSWYGLILGISERFDLQSILPTNVNTHIAALEEQRVKSERMLGEDRKTVDGVAQECANLRSTAASVRDEQQKAFDEMMAGRSSLFDKATTDHAGAMKRIQEAFKEDMKLRAPVSYWSDRSKEHEGNSIFWMRAAFGSMVVAPSLLAFVAYELLAETPVDKSPSAWKLAALALSSVFAVWFVRLVVRMYLSHVHLRADASERVTMVETYLALLEEGKIPDSEDRKLVLAPLFRPASDGIIKDEGLPHPVLEFFTRPGKG